MADSIIGALFGRSSTSTRDRQEAYNRKKQQEKTEAKAQAEARLAQEWEAAPPPDEPFRTTKEQAQMEQIEPQPAVIEPTIAEQIAPPPRPTEQVTTSTQETAKEPTQGFTQATDRRSKLVREQQELIDQIGRGEIANDERAARYMQDMNEELAAIDQQSNSEIRELQDSILNERADIEEKRQRLSQLTPENFWAKQDTPNKIKISLGLLLGAVGQSLTGAKQNAALTTLQNTVNQDLKIFNQSIDRRLKVLDKSDIGLDKKQAAIQQLENLRDARTKATIDRLGRQLDIFKLQTKNKNAIPKIEQLKLTLEEQLNSAQIAEEQKLAKTIQTAKVSKPVDNKHLKPDGTTKRGWTDAGKPQTQEEKKAEGYLERVEAANKIATQEPPPTEDLMRMATAFARLEEIPVVGDVLGAVRSAVGSTEADLFSKYGSWLNAMRDFQNAKLRKESGASIAPSEFIREARIYFPEPGDTPKVIKQKENARNLVVRSLINETGRNLGRLD